MRRPVICGGADQTGAEPPGQPEGALSRVRRLLSGSLPGRKNRNTFGVRLEELLERSDAQDGIPFAVIRLCSYIEEANGLEHETGAFHATANQKLVEKLKVGFDRNGDADLEACGDVSVAVALLKLFLRELPEPAITESAADDMLHAIRGSRDAVPEMRKAFSAMPEANRQLVRYLAAFMRLIVRRESHSATAMGVVFGPSLIRHRSFAQQNACNQIATRLVTDFHSIFPESATLDMHADAAPQQQLEAATVADNNSSGVPTQQRKRKERHESAGSSQVVQDRKVIRSNSQERSSEDLEVTRSDTTTTSDTSSVPVDNDTQQLLPLHEHNSSVAPMEDEDEETEHERRRSSERFASFPRTSAPRTSGSNRRFHQPRRQRRESKENHQQQQHEHQHHHAHRYQQQRHADDSCNSENISHAFLQLHPQEENETRERSPSPTTPPVLDLSTLHQQVDCSEPLTSQAPHHRVPEDTNVLLSPRNSMILTRRLDPNVAPSPPVEHVSRRREDGTDSRAKQLSKNINSLKKKIKLFEEQFEQQNGFRPSHADKLANKELKKLFAELNRLRKELKQVKEESTPLVTSRSMESTAASEEEPSVSADSRSLTDTLQEVERRLTEKREEAGRPTELEELSREQLLAEKVALQKALLHLESLHGRPASRTDRDLVRPLYDRYRSLKRLVVRSGGSKLRDSMSELATILEHEAMDFVATPEAPNTTAEAADTAGTAELPESGVTDDETPVISENLHALPISELLTRQQEARDEKKRLRRALREFEEEFQRDTGRRLQREDREPRQQEYMSYKQAKAKLRLLEALLAKHAQAPRSC